MDIRNAQHNANGGIDCEIEHPAYGWIPFTARQDDPEELGRNVYEAVKNIAAKYVAPPPDPKAERAIERQEASGYLASTDWMVLRMIETGEPVPSDVAKERAKARGKVQK